MCTGLQWNSSWPALNDQLGIGEERWCRDPAEDEMKRNDRSISIVREKREPDVRPLLVTPILFFHVDVAADSMTVEEEEWLSARLNCHGSTSIERWQ